MEILTYLCSLNLLNNFFLCNWKYMFWMFVILFSCYYSSQHIPCMWRNMRFFQPTITGQLFNIFCKSIFVGFSRNHSLTSHAFCCTNVLMKILTSLCSSSNLLNNSICVISNVLYVFHIVFMLFFVATHPLYVVKHEILPTNNYGPIL